MISHEVSFPTRILFGNGKLAKIGTEAAQLGRKALLDPTLTYSVPAKVTAESSADIFSHLFEAYLISAPGTHVQDGITESLIRQVVEFAPIALETLVADTIRIGGRGSGRVMGLRPLTASDVLAIYEACY